MKLFETNGNLRHEKTQERVDNVGYQVRTAIYHLIDCGCTRLELDAVVNLLYLGGSARICYG